jgi:hypothetical protein
VRPALVIGHPKRQEAVHCRRVGAQLEQGVTLEPPGVLWASHRFQQVRITTQHQVECRVRVAGEAPDQPPDLRPPGTVGVRLEYEVLSPLPPA